MEWTYKVEEIKVRRSSKQSDCTNSPFSLTTIPKLAVYFHIRKSHIICWPSRNPTCCFSCQPVSSLVAIEGNTLTTTGIKLIPYWPLQALCNPPWKRVQSVVASRSVYSAFQVPRWKEISDFTPALPRSLKRTDGSTSGPSPFSCFSIWMIHSTSNSVGELHGTSQTFTGFDVEVTTLERGQLNKSLKCPAQRSPVSYE